jgi:uncharacterized membrane protein
MQKPLLTPFYLIAAALVGLGDTLYLSYFQFMNLIPTCAVGGCEVVLTHATSKVFGVPLSYLGLVFYAYMLGLAVLLAYDPRGKGTRLAVLLYTLFGLLCSIGFELTQIFVIKALCMYCAISAAVTLVLFLVALWHWKKTKEI